MLLSSHPRLFALAAALLSAAAVFAVGMPENSSVAPSIRPQGGNGAQRMDAPPTDARLAADRNNWGEKLRRAPIEVEAGGSLFGSKSWTPPPPSPVAKAAPVMPPFPFQYMGKLVLDGGETTLYLTKGEEIYSVKAGAVITGNYRVERIEADFLEVTYLPLDKKQVLNYSSIVPPTRTDGIIVGRNNAPLTLSQVTSTTAPTHTESRPNAGVVARRGQPLSEGTAAAPAAAAAPTASMSVGSTGFAPISANPMQPAMPSVPVDRASGSTVPGDKATGNAGDMVFSPPPTSQMETFPPPMSQMQTFPPTAILVPTPPPSRGMSSSAPLR